MIRRPSSRQVARRVAMLLLGAPLLPGFAAAGEAPREQFTPVPMPPGFQVTSSELEGPVFADEKGHTLYTWPVKGLRNGPAGEQKNAPSCSSTRLTVTSGLMSPYPPGLELPELDRRPACTDVWPPVYAADDAKAVGKWTIVQRPDGRKQWAYDGYALYTSSLDLKAGDVLGASRLRRGADSPAYRIPVSPPPLVPPQFQVVEQRSGRFLVTGNGGMSVYAWNKDAAEKSNCRGRCEEIWAPVLAPALAKPQGEFTIFERAPGVKQWAFRKQPLYTHVIDDRPHALNGEDVPGWSIVYTQQPKAWPAGFTEQVTPGGMVLADAKGKTLYIYACADDALDQLACDHPSTPQAYRFAVCGGGKPDRCVQYFPYVIAPQDAKSDSALWTAKWIDPATGKWAAPRAPGALYVWCYRDRPVYTHLRDKAPGDIEADAWGEFNSFRNGYKAFWLRDDFVNNTG